MKICFLTTTYPRFEGDPTGSFIFGEVKALVASGHTVHVIAPRDPTVNSLKEERDGELIVHRFDYWFPASAQRLCYGAGIPENFRRNPLLAAQLPPLILGFAMRTLAFARACDLIHAHWTFGGLGGWMASRLAGKPLILSIYSAEIVAKLLAPLNRFLIRASAAQIANSSYTREAACQLVPGADPLVIPSGVNEEKMAPAGFNRSEFRQQAGLKDRDFVVFAIGRLVERKGFHLLVEAASHLPQDKDWKILIGGKGPQHDRLQAQIDEAGLNERVRLIGFVDDELLARWYAAADLFVLPSVVDSTGDTEGLGMVLVEAMANGTPVVASRTGGIVDIVEDEVSGLLVEAGNAAELANQIARVMQDQKLRRKLSSAAREKIQSTFSWDVLNRRLLEVYEAVTR